MINSKIRNSFDLAAKSRDSWRKKNNYYYKEISRLIRFFVPEGYTVLEIGCGTGDLLHSLRPKSGFGIDFSLGMLKRAKEKYSEYTYLAMDAEKLCLKNKFDFIVMSDLLGNLNDIWQAFREVSKVCAPNTRLIITYYNVLWEPILRLAEKLHLKTRQPAQNWLSFYDIENFLNLNGLEVVKKGSRFLFPIYIPLISDFINRYIARMPFLKRLCLLKYLVVRKIQDSVGRDFSCSIVVPCRNEAGNIENLISRINNVGSSTEIIFVDGCSSDETVSTINDCIKKYKNEKDIMLIHQGSAVGKADAVRKGFSVAKGDILIILDADITVSPEDLQKFYLALAEGKAEFVNGSRLVYPLEKDSMRFLNLIGNKFFCKFLNLIIEERITDALCGTKVLFREDYKKLVQQRDFFGAELDPFGDFELLFGAAKLNLKILEIPIRYKERIYGQTKIRRFKHGFILLKMSLFAFNKFKLS